LHEGDDFEVGQMNTSSPAMTSTQVDVRALTRQFGDFIAVDHVTITVDQGEIFGLIGPNGAGKSTLIKMLTTLLPPTSGVGLVAGYDVVRQSAEVRRHIGYVPQLLSADGALTGYENLLLSARLYGIPRAERKFRIERALARMGLSEHASQLVGRYSGGMIRRLEIAQGMMHHPAVLFLDEPTVGLDPTARRAVWNYVEDLRESMQSTMLLTTHYMEEAEVLCDRIAFIHRGRIQKVGTPEELKAPLGKDATLDDVFASLTGSQIEEPEGGYRDARRTRQSLRQRG
jgi:ABC-2 type transport system ATP-binding protein